jgi:hypothetical protein
MRHTDPVKKNPFKNGGGGKAGDGRGISKNIEEWIDGVHGGSMMVEK